MGQCSSREIFREQQHEFITSSWHNKSSFWSLLGQNIYSLVWVCCRFIIKSSTKITQIRFKITLNLRAPCPLCPVGEIVKIWQHWDTSKVSSRQDFSSRCYYCVVCGLKQTDTPRYPGPGGFDQLTGQAAAAAAVVCTWREKKQKRRRTQDLLTHLIMLFNEANKMPGYPGTSHTCVVEI